ncbi:hypothetical protein O181_033795 [Austropuccinia psidii MF-1]|uniref:Uncharacterized protein n=1 Tax=Austropuccinia psidii MF-1 TaxID=1389203 RepID=A0A9Q3H9K1_9BASI|nr:hypothetical protein [Austropuccinia psidii MF-1]
MAEDAGIADVAKIISRARSDELELSVLPICHIFLSEQREAVSSWHHPRPRPGIGTENTFFSNVSEESCTVLETFCSESQLLETHSKGSQHDVYIAVSIYPSKEILGVRVHHNTIYDYHLAYGHANTSTVRTRSTNVPADFESWNHDCFGVSVRISLKAGMGMGMLA